MRFGPADKALFARNREIWQSRNWIAAFAGMTKSKVYAVPFFLVTTG